MKLGNFSTKKKKARLCNTCFYRKKFISKDMKAINKQNEKIEKVRLFFQRKPLRPALIQNKSYVYKKNVKYDKNQILIYFFCEKPVSKPVKS